MKSRCLAAALLFLCGCVAAAGRQEGGFRIGVLTVDVSPALQAAERGLVEEIAALGHTVVRLESIPAGEAGGTDLAPGAPEARLAVAVGVGVRAARLLAERLPEVPLVFCAVPDPVGAGLVPGYAGGGSATGYSDLPPVRQQIELAVALTPIASLAFLYGDGGSAVVGMARQVADELGIGFFAVPVSATDEVREAARAVAGRVDAFYAGPDPVVDAALDDLLEEATAAGRPVVTGDPLGAVGRPVVLAYGPDYHAMGRSTARLAVLVAEVGGVGGFPVRFVEGPGSFLLHLDLDTAAVLGIEVPAGLLEAADRVVADGVMTTR